MTLPITSKVTIELILGVFGMNEEKAEAAADAIMFMVLQDKKIEQQKCKYVEIEA